jgi:hypothetical protein
VGQRLDQSHRIEYLSDLMVAFRFHP